MNGKWAWIIGAAPVTLKLRIFSTDSREEHTIEVIHDTSLLNKYFASYAISAYEHLIKGMVFDALHSEK